jgi:TatD DNase family protein
VHFQAFRDDMDEVVRRSLNAGVHMITVGTQRDTSANGVKLAERHDGVWAAVGLHPSHLFPGYLDEQEVQFKSRNEVFDPEYYRGLLKHPKVVALGEMGLDYHYTYEGVSDEQMKGKEAEAFAAGVKIALEEGLPVIIHCRDAHDDQIALIEKLYGPHHGDAPRGVVHCFTGTRHDAERYFALGFYVSFTGVITFPPKKSEVAAGKELLTDVVKWAPLDKIMVETDAPYLAPMPHRGQRNLPNYVKYVAEKIAELKGIPFGDVEEATTANAKRLFRKIGP